MTAEHQVHINGRVIPDLAKRRELGFEELRDRRIKSPCHRMTLARFYVGSDGISGKAEAWVWLPGYRAAGGIKVRPKATTIPMHDGEQAVTLATQCERCSTTWVVFPAGIPDDIAALPNGGTGWTVVLREGNPAPALDVGDRTTAGRLAADRIDGVGPCVLVRMETAEWGAVRDDTPGGGSTPQ